MRRAVSGRAGEGVAHEAREKRGVRVGPPGALAGCLALGGAELDHTKSVAAFAARMTA